jgi:hypothetical protein
MNVRGTEQGAWCLFFHTLEKAMEILLIELVFIIAKIIILGSPS